MVQNPHRIWIGIETSPGFMPGCYIQGSGGIYVGDYTQIGPGVGILSQNHDVHDTRQAIFKPVHIGQYCWLGMHAKVLPGVTLGDFTVVGAGSIVTKSFPEGYVVLAGNPARIVRKIEMSACVRYRSSQEYHGFIKSDEFFAYAKTHLELNWMHTSAIKHLAGDPLHANERS